MKNLNLLNLFDNSVCNFLFSLVAIIVYMISCYVFFALLGMATWLLNQNKPSRPKVANKPNKANTRWEALYKSLLDAPVQQSLT